jgi:hypothetical protein
MKPPTDIIDLLRSSLQTGVVSEAVEQAAAAYARLCQDCETRLERIAAMLDKGSDYQALQASEEEPSLLELAGVLSFGGEKAWFDFCQAHQLALAPRLDAKTVLALERLYAQGVTANHPLYKDFRAAVLSRENDRALRIIRTILKLNPADENARSELQRLENRQWQELADELSAALKTDDEERIAGLAERIIAVVPEARRAALPELVRAEGIRRSLRRRQAGEKIPELLGKAAEHEQAGEWEDAAQACDQVREMSEAHGIELTGSQKAAFESIGANCAQKRAAAELRRRFERALSGFAAFIQEAETRLLTGTARSLAESAALDESFVRRWRDLEAFGLPVPEDVLARLRHAGLKIRENLEHVQRGRRMRSLASAAVLAGFLAALAAVAWHGWQARAYALELASYRARQLAEPAARLAATLRTEQPLLLRWPYLRTKVEETDAWTGQGRGLLAQADAVLKALESEFDGLRPAEMLRRLEDARALVAQLPADLATPAGQRIAALKTRSGLKMAGLGEARTADTREKLGRINPALREELSHERPVAQVVASLVRLEGVLAALESLTRPEAEELRLPADLEAQIRAARQRVEAFKADVERFNGLRDAAASATSLTEYRAVLARWQDIPFAEAASAASVLDSLPSEEQLLASLMAGGDLAMWKACVEDAGGPSMHPETPQEGDLKTLLALRDDPGLNSVWENVVVDHSTGRGRRSVWSLGPLVESRVADTQQRWSGRAFDPHPQDTGAAFVPLEFKRLVINGGSPQGQSVVSSKPSATGNLIKNLQLDRMTDANGERFERSLLGILDRLMADGGAPSVARAYVMLELERLTRDRPFAWGLHLTPTLRADLAELHRRVGDYPLRGDDWMLPKVREKLGGVLDEFFSARLGRQYEKEAQARRLLVMRVNAAGVKLGGFVDTERRLMVSQAGRAAAEFWLPLKAGPRLLKAAEVEAPEGVPGLTPLLFLPLDRQELMRNYRASMSGPEQGRTAPSQDEDPFLKP